MDAAFSIPGGHAVSKAFYLAPKIEIDGREIADLGKKLKALPEKEWPFALARALTATGKRAVPHVQGRAEKAFIIRKPWVLKGIRSTFATKQNLEVEVGSRDDFMKEQVDGGDRKAKSHRIPVPVNIRRDVTRAIPRSKFPAALLKAQKVRR